MSMFFIIATFLHVLPLHTANGFITNASIDQAALLALKSHVHYSDILQQNWSTVTNVCAWVGVTCGSRHPRVIGLNLSNMNIKGTLPPELGQLSFLKYLNISFNHFQGKLPNELFGLRKLRWLDMANNTFSGQLPGDIGKLKRLQALNLYGNSFEGKIPKEIGYLDELNRLVLANNNFSGSIPTEAGNLTKLMQLSLQTNHLTGSIPRSIFNISTLQLLILNDNYLSGTLPSTMGQNLPNLTFLFLNKNLLTGTIPQSISNCTSLVIISLEQNKFSGPIPSSLGNLNSLTCLHLHENALSSDSPRELAFLTSLTRCRKLMDISLSGNPLNAALPTSIGNLSPTLTRVYFRGCGIKGNIPSEIGNLSSLLTLDLSDNNLSGTMPGTINEMHGLQGLLLGKNRISGPFPGDLCDLQGLYILDLSNNEFSGSIPECIGSVTSLHVLTLSNNRFDLHIPSNMWSLTDLVTLDLSRNLFTGNLPHQGIRDMMSIHYMDLSSNQLTGNISEEFGIDSLAFLSLARNKLQGEIPKSVGKMVNMEWLDLSDNNLSGEIPEALESLQFLTYLNVSHNRLKGRIPSGGSFERLDDYKLFESNAGLCGSPQLRVPLCPRPRSKRLLIIVALSTSASLVLIVILAFLWMMKYKKKQVSSPDPQTKVAFQRFSYQQIQDATDGFSHKRFLGSGSFGSVYKAIFKNGLLCAVKVFNLQNQDAGKSFDRECEVLGNLRHRNLTHVISVCSRLDFKALILEYMANGSLEDWLHPADCQFLNIMQRLDIMIDVASALEYLYYGYLKPVLHCDLKPSNILLDEDMVGHVTDFGIAKFLRDDESYVHTKTIATLGYIAPEYGTEGLVSSASDVYSFGILMMETFTGKRPCDDMFTGDVSLRGWIKSFEPNELNQVVDSSLLDEVEELQHVSSIIELALNCTFECPKERLDIKDVLKTLENIKLKVKRTCWLKTE